MTSQQLDQIRHLASRYIWWQSPEEVMSQPDRLIAQIMNLGDYADVQYMVNAIGAGPLLKALSSAQAGQFNPRSWHYWHYRLGLKSSKESLPALPKRTFQ